MDPERWQQVKAALIGALEHEPHRRGAALGAICGKDEDLRREVESLLESEAESPSIVDEPVFQLLAVAAPEEELRHIGPYEILRRIGRGGLGIVYLAVRADQEYTQRVAVKVIRRGLDTEEVVRRFRAERQILANLEHPHIARLLDGGTTDDGRPYFVMEYVEGEAIDRYCASRRLSLAVRLELVETVCEVVHFAHQNLVVHCDLKPANVLVSEQGPKLLDFGISKLLAGNGSSLETLTRPGARPMTPDYASPEQARGEPVTVASDVYALGVLLYEVLTEQPLHRFGDLEPEELARRIGEQAPPRPSAAVRREASAPERPGRLRRLLQGDLDTIVLKAVHEDPRRRYGSAAQLAEDLQRHRRGFPVIARADTLAYRTGKFVRRHAAGVALAAAGFLLVVGFAVTATVLWQKASRERENAVRQQQRAERVSSFLEELFEVSDPIRGGDQRPPTLEELLERGRRKVIAGLEDEAEPQAALMATLGRVYANLGAYEEARELLEGALEVRRRSLGEDHLMVAESQHNLALLLLRAGHSEAAEPLLRRALALQREHHLQGTPEFVRGLTNLSALYEMRGDFHAAEELYREVLAAKRDLFGAEHREVATSLNNLGTVLFRQGDYQASEPLLRQALAQRRRLGGSEIEVATSLNNLANLLTAVGGMAEAETCYRESLRIRQRVLGADHLKVATGLNNLGFFLQHNGDFGAAEELYVQALGILSEQLEERHPDRAVVLRNLASVRGARGDAEGCDEAAQEAMEIFAASLPAAHWRSADSRSVLGACRLAAGRYGEAESLMVDSYWTILRVRGVQAPHTEDALDRLIRLYGTWNRPEEAARFRALRSAAGSARGTPEAPSQPAPFPPKR